LAAESEAAKAAMAQTRLEDHLRIGHTPAQVLREPDRSTFG
jgi:hypothetical protein